MRQRSVSTRFASSRQFGYAAIIILRPVRDRSSRGSNFVLSYSHRYVLQIHASMWGQ